MPKLTDVGIRALAPKEKLYRIADGDNLYLEVAPNGSKRWRFRYMKDGKATMLSLGTYPSVTLAEARQEAKRLRGELFAGTDPMAAKRSRLLDGAQTFEAIAAEWFERRMADRSPKYREVVQSRLKREILPYLGARPITEIRAPEILALLRRIENRGLLETARRVRTVIGQVFRYGMAIGAVESDPTIALHGALKQPKVRHMPAPTTPEEVAAILRAISAFKGTPIVSAALRLLPYLFVRPGELRQMRWAEIDFARAEWRFTASKTATDHIVPLSRQALTILREELYPLSGRFVWVFPGGRTPERPMSDNAIVAAYRRLGIGKDELVAHGWRAVARTLLHEELGFPPEVIEHQLAHKVPDPLGRAYNRTRFIEQRREMMQRWADYLDALREG
ncbi:tyrosine-type recombinase/integrase [Hydrogenophilus thermoluteolus]|uniref:Integrase n=1 Tax=Hydrogenophilus thermoluteolus TaxID=297 RepID=A0A2Z6DY52_HYDTE|nr:integrase arm-type DNA-binding domain-containing protein [Hydrogenophilus thermoluteolus]BBD77403.1 integrase [Hydrogenophilus thermoluteolus]